MELHAGGPAGGGEGIRRGVGQAAGGDEALGHAGRVGAGGGQAPRHVGEDQCPAGRRQPGDQAVDRAGRGEAVTVGVGHDRAGPQHGLHQPMRAVLVQTGGHPDVDVVEAVAAQRDQAQGVDHVARQVGHRRVLPVPAGGPVRAGGLRAEVGDLEPVGDGG